MSAEQPAYNPNYNPPNYADSQGQGPDNFQGAPAQPPPAYTYSQPLNYPPQQPTVIVQPAGYDAEVATEYKADILSFDNKSVRAGFIRKVFGLLTVMLAIVFGICLLFCLEKKCNTFVMENTWIYWISYFVFLGSYICILCCEGIRRKFPGNLICLFILTLSMGYMTGMISAMYQIQSVFLGMGICTLCCFAVILFACQTKFDFMSCIGVIFILTMCLFFFGITIMFYSIFWNTQVLYVVYAGIGAVLFMLFLAIDTQMVVGGKRFSYSPEDYIMAAVQLFLDIIYIFIFLLQIIGGVKK